jgi:hypothetical protein
VSSVTATPAIVVLPAAVATQVTAALAAHDVAQGGVWNAAATLWQRYDRAWDGPNGTHGSAQLMGTIGTLPATPTPDQITIFRSMVTPQGRALGWSEASLCDDALAHAGESLASLGAAPPKFFRRDPREPVVVPDTVRELLHTDVRDVLRSEVRDLVRLLTKRNRGE